MDDVWQTLRDGGLPLALPTSGARPTPPALADAALAAIAAAPVGREAEALAAYIFAWHQHWPDSFAQSFSTSKDDVLAWATSAAIDDNRYLKLRRIALANLAAVL